MRTPPLRSRRPLLVRAAVLAAIAALSAAVAGAGPVRGAGDSVIHAAASAWKGLLGDRPASSSGQKMIVLLEAPSLVDRMAAAETPASTEDQKRWVGEADASQRILLAQLAERGVVLRRERSFTRTLNGFSAEIDARALAELERTDAVAGLYPVRVVYPASITSQALTRPEFRAGAGRRPDVGLPGFEGVGVRIALLDSGVDLDHPYLNGRVLPGYDVADRDRRAAAEPKPDEPARRESHGTLMAGILVGSDGPAGLRGVAPGAQVLPIRILDWERASDGSYQLLGRGDVLIAGLERAVDPDADGDVDDAAAVALAAVVEPYASFADSPEARSVDGAARLGTLVVGAAGNDGRGGRGFGTVGAPGGTPAAIGVGALDARAEALDARTVVRVGAANVLDEQARVVGALPPEGALPVAALVGPTLGDPKRATGAVATGAKLADFFDAQGLSTVAGHAAVLPAGPKLEDVVRNAMAAGATALVVYGAAEPAGSLDLDETTAIPVVSIPAAAGRAVVEGLARGEVVSVAFGPARRVGNATVGQVAPFSSGGVSFGGNVKPDLVAPGVGIATADAGMNADGSPHYATATGSSVAAAVVAGSAAVLAQARPGLTATELRSLLVGSAQQIVREGRPDPVTVQGAGVVDPAAAAAAEIAVAPVTLAYGRAGRTGWRVTQTVSVRNLSTRTLDVGFGITRDRWGKPEISFSAAPANLALRAGSAADVTLVASASGPLEGDAAGAFVVSPRGSRPVRVPWAVSFRGTQEEPLISSVALSERSFAPSDSAPAVVAFRVGRVAADGSGHALDAVQLLEAELWAADGARRLGVLGRLNHLLPGRYAFGLTGRGPRGNTLGRGDYVLRLRAQPVPGDAGARATSVDVPFTIRG